MWVVAIGTFGMSSRKVAVAKGGASTYRGQKIQFCCPPCKVKFDKNPDKYMRLMRADPLAYAYDRPGPTNTQMRAAMDGADILVTATSAQAITAVNHTGLTVR